MDASRTWVVAVAAGLCGVVLGAGAAVVYQKSRPVPRSKAVALLRAQLDERDRTIELLTEKYNEAVSSQASEESSTPPPSPAPKAPSPVRQFTYIKSVKAAAPSSIVADFAQFLTGKAAASAAAKAGDESPPPNDYYIVNDNPKLRTLAVSPTVAVRLTTEDDGAPLPEGYDSTLAAFAKQLKANPDWAQYRHFWITIEDGVVTRIEEQFTP